MHVSSRYLRILPRRSLRWTAIISIVGYCYATAQCAVREAVHTACPPSQAACDSANADSHDHHGASNSDQNHHGEEGQSSSDEKSCCSSFIAGAIYQSSTTTVAPSFSLKTITEFAFIQPDAISQRIHFSLIRGPPRLSSAQLLLSCLAAPRGPPSHS